MPNGRSQIGNAQTMTLSVAKALGDADNSMLQYQQHLQNRRAHLENLLHDSHQDDVKSLLAQVDAAIAALKLCMSQVRDAADRAVKIEARL